MSHDAPTVSARFVYGFTTTHAGSATVHSDGATNAQDTLDTLLYGCSTLDNERNKFIINAVLVYIKDSKRFD